jgi:hypothetical protein
MIKSRVFLAGALLVAAAGTAHAGLTVTPAVVSDYDFRGVTQTANDPAVQVGATYAFDSGLYVGGWGSNIKFGAGDPKLELDWSAGYTFGDAKEGFKPRSAGYKSQGGAEGGPARASGYKSHAAGGADAGKPARAPYGDKPRTYEPRGKAEGDSRPAKPFGAKPYAAKSFGDKPARSGGFKSHAAGGDAPKTYAKPAAPRDAGDTSKRFVPPRKPKA